MDMQKADYEMTRIISLLRDKTDKELSAIYNLLKDKQHKMINLNKPLATGYNLDNMMAECNKNNYDYTNTLLIVANQVDLNSQWWIVESKVYNE